MRRLIEESDEKLWLACVAGDAEAFGVLFERHADAVFRCCLTRCGSWHDAEELVSVTFLEAWRQRTRLKLQRNSVLPWLLGVATNANRNRARAAKRHLAFLAKLPFSDPRHGEHEVDHADAVTTRLNAERSVRELLDSTVGLSSGERGVVILCLMNDVGLEDAAMALGIRPGTVKSRLNRARTKLTAASEPGKANQYTDTKIVESRFS